MSKEDKQLKVVETLGEQALKIPEEIKSEKQAFAAADLILQVRKMFNEIEEERKKRTSPANETIAIINADFKKFLTPLKDVETKMKNALEAYACHRIEEDLKKLENLQQETGDKTLTIPVGISSLPSEEGEVRFRKSHVAVVVDEKKVPRKYMTVDLKKIQKEVDQNDGEVKIAGIEVKPSSSAALYVK